MSSLAKSSVIHSSILRWIHSRFLGAFKEENCHGHKVWFYISQRVQTSDETYDLKFD